MAAVDDAVSVMDENMVPKSEEPEAYGTYKEFEK